MVGGMAPMSQSKRPPEAVDDDDDEDLDEHMEDDEEAMKLDSVLEDEGLEDVCSVLAALTS